MLRHFLEGGVARKAPKTAKRSETIAQAAVATLWRALMLSYVTPKASRDVGFAKSGLQAWEPTPAGMRPHKEPGGITFEFGSMRMVSGSEGPNQGSHGEKRPRAGWRCCRGNRMCLSPPFEMILLGRATCGAPSGRIPAGVGSKARRPDFAKRLD